MADKMALGQFFLRVLRFSPVSIIPPLLSLDKHHPEGTTVISETQSHPIDVNVTNM
jgi:branched-subunit amino acid transport protein